MIPILFDDGEREFNTNGLGRLSDCISFLVTEERNGIFECEFEYPITGIHYEEIKAGRFVYATHDDTGRCQAFEVYGKTAPINGSVIFYGRHISYMLNKTVVMPFSASSITEVMAKIPTKIPTSSSFTFWTDKSTVGKFTLLEPKPVRSLLGGSEGSILDVYGKGDYEWDMFSVRLHQDRGSDSDVEIRYGKNMSDLTVEEDAGETYNAIVPYWKGTVEDEEVVITLSEGAIIYDQATRRLAYLTDEMQDVLREEHGEPLEVFFRIYEAVPLDMSSEFQEPPTESELRAAAETYLNNSTGWEPAENITVDFVQMWQTEEYKDVAPLQMVRLCDTVSVYYPELGVVAVKKKVVKTTYNTLLDRYDKIELGDLQYSFAEIITGQILNEVPTTGMMDEAIEHATQLISGGLGGYVILKPNAAGKPEEILIMDSEDIDQAVNVIRMNKNGIGFSRTGYQGPYTTAWTIDGSFVADFITAGTLNANLIKAGVLSDVDGNTTLNLETGKLDITKGSIDLGSGKFSVDSGGNIQAKYGIIGSMHIIANGGLEFYKHGRALRLLRSADWASADTQPMLEIVDDDGYTQFTLNGDGSVWIAPVTGGGGTNYSYEFKKDYCQIDGNNNRITFYDSGIEIYPGKTTTAHRGNLWIDSDGVLYKANEGSSSHKIKHDIKAIEKDELNPKRLYDVEVVQFKYNDAFLDDDDPNKGKDLVGFIVEELNEIYPVAVNSESKDSKDWTWSEAMLIPPMLKLIQDQKKEIDKLRGEVEMIKEIISENK